MTYAPPHRALDRVFKISILLKGLDGAFELVGGIALLFVDPQWVRTWWSGWTSHLLVGHEHSPLWHWFIHLADALNTKATVFAAVYLLLHGVIKVVLVWALLRQKYWAYPWMIAALGVFIAYQCYELIVHFTWPMLLLTVFDVFIVILTWREWQLHKKSLEITVVEVA